VKWVLITITDQEDKTMGTTQKKSLKARKATFTVETVKGVRQFTAVNKRAHTVCKKAGKRSKLSVKELKGLVGAGTYKFYFYDKDGTLKPVKF
jgi:hypothetical protein